MARDSVPLFAFNSGQVSELALARVDLSKMRLAGVLQKNLLPTVLGPMVFRPGTAYLDTTISNQEPFLMPFVFNAETTALAVVSGSGIQVMVDGVFVTRPSVTTAITNGGFDTDLTGWTDSDESGAASTWVAGGFLSLVGTGANYAIRQQSVTTVETGTEHAINVVVSLGPVKFQVGTTSGGKDIFDTMLGTGTHSLGFTPAGNFHITVSANNVARRLVSSITIEAAGRMTLPNPWSSDYKKLRYAQSGDIIYIACENVQQQQFERRSQRAWSIVKYLALDGPFRSQNIDLGTTLTASAVSGLITLTASRPIFTTGHVGAVFQIQHPTQTATAILAGDGQSGSYIKVTGASDFERTFSFSLSGVVDSIVTLQWSFGVPDQWRDFRQFTSDFSTSGHDGLENQIVYYRWTIKTGDYGTDTVTTTLSFDGTVTKAVVHILNYTDTTHVVAETVTTVGDTAATSLWSEGDWSVQRGFPSSVVFHDGRLCWGWKDRVYMSVSDAFNSFDPTVVGDSAPVIRSVATGAFEGLRWLLSTQYLLAGTASQEVSMRGDGFGEAISPTKFTAREFSNRGCADIAAIKVDGRGVFVQRNGRRIFGAAYDVNASDYASQDLTRLCPEICADDVVSIAVQRQPDTRIWFVLADGTAVVLTFEPDEQVVAWTPVTTDGLIKAVSVLPGDDEDEVYLAVRRTNNGGNIMAIEKLAMLSECRGGLTSKNVDCHVVYSGSPTTTISGLSHLQGLSVVAWADGAALAGTFTVTAGAITLLAAASKVVVGLAYTGQFKSVKLAYASGVGTALSKAKRAVHLSMLMAYVSWDGVQVGRNFSELDSLGGTYNGKVLTTGQVLDFFDDRPSVFNGGWGADERFCIQISSPHCATFMAASIDVTTSDGVIKRDAQG
jgi:hypothetical protein